VWKSFQVITVDGSATEYVACRQCMSVVTHKKKDGTHGLHLHKCKSSSESISGPKQSTIKSFTGKKQLPPVARDQLRNAIVQFIAKDIRPFSVVHGDGFLAYSQTLVNLTATHGKFNVKEALPSATTLSRNLPATVEDVKNDVRERLAAADFVALTTDGWTDDHRKYSYVTVTAHFFDPDLKLQSSVLNTGCVEERKTADVLGKVVADVASDFGLTMNKVTVVTDNASNMIAAFRGLCCRLSCFAHCLNLVVTDMLASCEPELTDMLNNCKSLVRHFKHTELQHSLKQTLKQECPTRWNSVFMMLHSIHSQFDDIYAVLSDRKELRYVYAIDKDMMLAVIDFLQNFKDASEAVSSESKPTLHLVVPLMHRLSSLCEQQSEDDHPVVQSLKLKASQLLQSKVRLDDMHDVAVLLNPNMKRLRFLPGIFLHMM